MCPSSPAHRHPTSERDRGRQRQQHHRDLHHEDRPPRERRSQEPPDHRTERRPGDTGRGPPPHTRSLDPGARNQQLEASHDHQRATGRLRPPRRDQHAERRRGCAHGRRGREPDHATRGHRGRIPAHAHARRRDRHQREHEVKRDQNPRDLANRGSEVPEDLRQGQGHHARVPENNGDGQRQHRDRGGACRQGLAGWSVRSVPIRWEPCPILTRHAGHGIRHKTTAYRPGDSPARRVLARPQLRPAALFTKTTVRAR